MENSNPDSSAISTLFQNVFDAFLRQIDQEIEDDYTEDVYIVSPSLIQQIQTEIHIDIPNDPGSKYSDMLKAFIVLDIAISKLNIFSINETLEDIHTQDLKYLTVPYCMGILHNSIKDDIENRGKHLRDSQVCILKFLDQCDQFDMLNDKQKKKFEFIMECLKYPLERQISTFKNVKQSQLSPADRRTQLIADMKIRKEKLQHLKMLALACKSTNVDEETLRQYYVALIERFVDESLSHLDYIFQELEILSMRKDYVEIKAQEQPKPSTASSNKKNIFTITNKADLYNYYRDRVFQPGHNLPTISLAECADIEMELETRQIGVSKQPVVMEYATGEARAAANEETEYEDRAWDDWKDENPRGSGNKQYRRG